MQKNKKIQKRISRIYIIEFLCFKLNDDRNRKANGKLKKEFKN